MRAPSVSMNIPHIPGTNRGRAFLIAGLLTASAFSLVAQNKPLYLDSSAPIEKRIDDLLPRLTLDEKINLVRANGKFRSGGVERLGIPYLWTADGPQGVREEVEVDSWSPAGWTNDFATALPPGTTIAATWDPGLAAACGKVIGEEARQRGKHVLLGPGMNIMRTPLCGRNYDYYGEDPWLASRMTVGYVKGMQAEQTAVCLKHFVANNQEFERSSINVEMDERTLREIYLPAFEAGVKEAGALSVMGAYNKFRGQHCCHNDYLLNQVLKGEWHFQGSVISDWDGTHDTREAALNGLDLEMGTGKSYENFYLSKAYKEGIQRGEFPMAGLDDKVRRNLRVLFATGGVDGRRSGSINTREHQEIARKIAQEGMVLLKNSGNLLPITAEKYPTIAIIGENATRLFAAGENSAGVKAFREISALQGILARVGSRANITYSAGYLQPKASRSDTRDAAGAQVNQQVIKDQEQARLLADRAVQVAKAADLVIFVGGYCHQAYGDDEAYDRKDLHLSSDQDGLIARIAEANPRTIVTLISGSPIVMPWLDKVPAVLQAWYGGSEAGNALASVLFGDVNPSGKLPFSFPKALSDSPAHTGDARTFPGANGTVEYREGLLVGYRWFDTKQIEPLFPFGYGLSYTTFSYGGLNITANPAAHMVNIECEITNTGQREGAEVVQVYVQPRKPSLMRPTKELKGFTKVNLKPGETRKITVALNDRAFAYYSPKQKGWIAEAGEYGILVGASSRDIRQSGAFKLSQTLSLP